MNSKILTIALGELGVKERAGKKHNPRIIEYHSVTTLNATTDEVPWCSSFVNWVVIQAGHEPTRSAMAASWKRWGKRLKRPKKGCIAGFVRSDGTGHVGIYVSGDSGKYKLLGGNQSNAVNVSTWNVANRDWFFVEPKTFFNSKIAKSGAGASIAGGTLAAPTIIEIIKELQASTQEATDGVTAITKTLAGNIPASVLEQASPFIVIALSLFIIYDRLKKERTRY